MSMKVNKNGKEYDLGFMPEHYPADRVYLDGDISKTVQDLMPIDVSNRFSSNQSNVFISAKKNNNGTVTVNLSAKGSFGNGAIVFYPDATLPVPSRLRGGYLGMGTAVNLDSAPATYVNTLASIDTNGIFYILYEQGITANIVEFSVTYPLS